MKGTLITKTKRSQRLALTTSEWISYCSVATFFLFIGLSFLWATIDKAILDPNGAGHSVTKLLSLTVSFLIVGAILMVIQWRRLKMRMISVDYTALELDDVVHRTADEMRWRIEHNNKRVVVAYSPDKRLFGTHGKRITILKLKDGLLWNCIYDPHTHSSFVSLWGVENDLRSFMANLVDVQKGVPARPKEIPKSDPDEWIIRHEWTFGKVLMRLVLYPLSLFFIALFCYVTYDLLADSTELFADGKKHVLPVFIFVVPACLAVVFIVSDIRMIAAKWQSERAAARTIDRR